MPTHFIVHDKTDTVGVVVTEDVQPGKELTGWIMETDETVALQSLDAVPLGHKIALGDIKSGQPMTLVAPSRISAAGAMCTFTT